MKLAHKIINRLRREIRHSVAYTRARTFNTKLADGDVLAAWHASVEPESGGCVEEWIASKPCVYAGDLESPLSIETIIRESNRVLQGSIILLNQNFTLKPPALWKKDPLTHRTWPTTVHFTRFNVFHSSRDGKTDIRRIWELGRFGWILPLARGYAATRRLDYAKAWSDYMTDFIEHNPPEFGPHWLNAMEVSIRAVQWCRATSLLFSSQPASLLHSEFPVLDSILPSLLAHGRYIRSHLEWTPYGRTNHYIADLVGLLTISTFVPQFRESKEWLKFARQGLIHEIKEQTDSEGFHSEASTAYHHFALELYMLALAIGDQHQLRFPSDFRKRVQQMWEIDRAIRGKENLDPQIGDDDSGTLQLSEHGIIDEGWKAKSQKSVTRSLSLKKSGIYILRSSEVSCHVACGPNGQQGVGGHSHNDKLSVVIRVKGVPFIVDSGTCCYSASTQTRDLFRSTAMHNTITVDGNEQSPFRDWRKLRDHARARCLIWKDSPEESFFLGEHSGYRNLGVVHRRTIQLDKAHHRLTVLDEIESRKTHTYRFYLHLAPSVTRQNVKLEARRVILPGAHLIFRDALGLELLDTLASPHYGAQVPNLTLHFQMTVSGKWQLPWEMRSNA